MQKGGPRTLGKMPSVMTFAVLFALETALMAKIFPLICTLETNAVASDLSTLVLPASTVELVMTAVGPSCTTIVKSLFLTTVTTPKIGLCKTDGELPIWPISACAIPTKIRKPAMAIPVGILWVFFMGSNEI